MSRARWKGPVSLKRSSSITPSLVGRVMAVHNGRTFVPIKITTDRVGHKLGELAISKKPAIF